jgi:hypothetical protein
MPKKHGSASLSPRRASVVLLISVAALSGISCKPAPPPAPVISLTTVMQTVREYGRGKEAAQPIPSKVLAAPATRPSHELYDADGAYQAHIALIFMQGDFAQLEQEAEKARASKARLTGGVWKLYGFYEGVANPSGEGHSTEADWSAQLADIKKWIAAYPESATARIALAEAYISYAWVARGVGYARTVTRSGWKLFGQRIEIAKSTLVEAARLKQKCPYWYGVMQNVALAEGWEESVARELFQRAAEFEPSFLTYYRGYAYFVLPKWYGKPGEAEEFAEEVSQKAGGLEGDIYYFEIGSEIACQYDLYESPVPRMSWERMKAGYAAIDQLYGQSNLKANRFAFMAYLLGDKPAAQEAFTFLGDNRDPTVWDKGQFAFVKAWASAP